MVRHPAAGAWRPEVDGLRAVAVLAVIFFHAGFGWAPGGYLGVDVFFVISGFLITGIILDDQAAGRFSLAGFYARRFRRILPALVLVALCCVPVALAVLPGPQLRDFFNDLAAVGLFASNFYIGSTTGYFDAPAESRVLLHTWSLAVEEQFYLLFPALMLAAHGGRTRWRMALLLALGAASLGAAEWGWQRFRSETFFFLHGRVWELLLGALAAFIARRWPLAAWSPEAARPRPGTGVRGACELLALGGLAAIVGPIVWFDAHTPTPSLHTLVPTLGTAAVLLFARQGTLAARLLALPPLVGIGLISYSAYLWHQPLLAFARALSLQPLTQPAVWALVAATLALAFLSWKFVEQPFRRMTRVNHRRTLAVGMAASLLLVGLGLAGSLWAQQAGAGKVPASVTRAFEPHRLAKRCFDVAQAHTKTREADWTCALNEKAEAAPSFMVFGDSHALQLFDVFDAAARQAGRRGVFAGYSGCVPILGVHQLTRPDQGTRDCNLMNKHVLAYVQARKIQDLFLVAKWSYYTNMSFDGRYINAIGLSKGDPITLGYSRMSFQQGLLRTAQTYAGMGVRLHVIEQVPKQLHEPSKAYEKAYTSADVAATLRELSVRAEQHRQLQSHTRGLFQDLARQGGLNLLNFDDLYCDPQLCLIGTPTSSNYSDLTHISAEGARRMQPALARALAGRAPAAGR